MRRTTGAHSRSRFVSVLVSGLLLARQHSDLQTTATGARVITKQKAQRKAMSCVVEMDLKNNKGTVKEKENINWKIVAGNLALLSTFAMLFFLVTRKSEKKKLKKTPVLAPISSIAETEELIRKKMVNHLEENI